MGLTILAMIVGAAVATITKPTYTAERDLFVGKTLSLSNTASIAGLPAAATQIAGDYSRLISTGQVISGTEARLGHPGQLGGSLSATQIPQSPEIRVLASARSAAAAVALANAGSQALIDTINQINGASSGQLNDLLNQYQQVEQAINTDQQRLSSLQSQIALLQKDTTAAGQSQLTTAQQALTALQAQMAGLTLQANAINAQYQNEYSPVMQEEQVIAPVGSAHATGNTRKRAFELGLVIGAVGGLLIAVAWASITDFRRGGRASLPPPRI